MYTIHSTCLLETVNGRTRDGYLIGSGTDIKTCSSFQQAELIKQVWPGQDIIGIFYSSMLDESKIKPNFVLFNTSNYKLHMANDDGIKYTITSTKTETAAINSCDTTNNEVRLEYAFQQYKSELSAASDNSNKVHSLKSIVSPCSDDQLRQYSANLEKLIECHVASSLLLQTQDLVDNLANVKMGQQSGQQSQKRFRKNK